MESTVISELIRGFIVATTAHLHECISRILCHSNCASNPYPDKKNFYSDCNWKCDEKGCRCEISWSLEHFDVDFQYYLLPSPKLLTVWIQKKENQERLFFSPGKKVYLKQSSCEQGLHLYVLQWRSDYYAAEFELVYLFWCHNIEIKEHSAVNVRVILNNIKWDIYLKRWGIWLYPVARSWTIM